MQVIVIFQDPYSSLNPRMTAGHLLGEPLLVQGLLRRFRAMRLGGRNQPVDLVERLAEVA
jgi:ABC-type microcin C transport system duplicated ATPase subunit YejF